MVRVASSRRRVRYDAIAVLAVATITVLALGWIVASDLRESADDTHQLYERFAEGDDLIDKVLIETEEVRRILLYALHTLDANRQLQYAEQSRAAEANVRRLLETRSAPLANPGTRAGLQKVADAWKQYVMVRDEVIGLILEGSLTEGVALDEQQGAARFAAVRSAIAELKAIFEADAARQVAEQRVRANRDITRLSLMVISTLMGTAIGIYLFNRRAALEGLLRSEAHKGSILQAVPNPIISTDANGMIIELNDAAERTFQLTRADALGRHIDEMILPAAMRGLLTEAFSGLRPAAPAARVETTGERRDGTQFPMEVAATSHLAGRDLVWTVHVSDLTDRRQAEEHLRRAMEAAEAAAQVKSDFLATMSHELRTPLTGVVGIADLLKATELAPPQRDLVRMLRSSATMLLSLVNDILDYSRIEAGLMALTPVRFSLRNVVEDALDPVTELAARKGLDIGYVIEPGVPDVVADEDRIRQVLINLLSNAVKFTDTGEVAVRVDARLKDQTATVTIGVRDTGVGIPAVLQHKLFQRFSQLDTAAGRQVGGAGLGLAISERLSRVLGGSMTVESREGHGSTFTFVFTAQIASPSAAESHARGPLRGVRVLAFLGTGIVGEQIHSLLREWGVHVTLVSGEPPAPPTGVEVDVILVDASASKGTLNAAVVTGRERWGLAHVPVITVKRLRSADDWDRRLPGQVIATPVRAEALHDALAKAAGLELAAPGIDNGAPGRPPFEADALTILLVEDNDANRRVVRLMLTELGLEADEAASGLEAVERARRRHYDVILMDVQMPGIDGLEATRRIRTEQRGTPSIILALTANVMESDEARCREAGMNGYLSKPLRLNTLEAALGSLVSPRS
jgi:PAS domain S-box-containing protein